ncbi:MAG: S-layer homology domain-containing protein [Oscillospiraceae bacterium]|nr:S-layer homology domain-containing protein [Oscillospiraceae bacterium]
MRQFLTLLCLLAVLTGCTSGALPESESAELSAADGTFIDIAGHPMEYEILEGLELGLYRVPSDGRFRPDEPATHGDFLLALWNFSGRPGDSANELQNALDWAADTEYPDNVPATPDDPITRQEAMSILYTHNGGVSGVEAMLTGIYDNGFRDSAQIPPGGKAALYWGFYNVLIRETEPGIISPSGTVSRGDMADIMIRYVNMFRGESPEN